MIILCECSYETKFVQPSDIMLDSSTLLVFFRCMQRKLKYAMTRKRRNLKEIPTSKTAMGKQTKLTIRYKCSYTRNIS